MSQLQSPTTPPTVDVQASEPLLKAEVLKLQERVLRFAVVEQSLIDLRAELDEERAQIGRIHDFCRRLFHAQDESAFDLVVAESVVDVFEQQFGMFCRFPAPGVLPEVLNPACAGLPACSSPWMSWLRESVSKLAGREAVLSPEALASQPGKVAGHLVVGFCRDQNQEPVAMIVTGVLEQGMPFHELLQAQRMLSFGMFVQKVSVLLMMRRFGARIAEQALKVRQSEEQLALALEAGNVGAWDRDLASGVTHFSPIWKSMLGYEDHELPNEHAKWLKLVHPQDLEACLELEAMHLRGETECFEHTYRLRHRSGHDIWVLSRGKALRDASGMPVRFFGAVVDVTRQKTIEERLRQAEDLERNARHQAEAATRAKSAFVASMSHEIRTPMNGVLGMLQILRGTPLNADQSALVATAERSALCLLDLIGDILDLSKVEAGKLEIHPEPFAWQPLLSEVADLMRTRAEAKDIDLRVEVTAPPPAWLLGDSLRLRQILTNLINNAIKFTDHGGVTVTLESAALPDQPGMHRLLWRVKDTGIGISPAAMGRLFKPFSQVDDSTENYRGGTGLGLSISQSLARLMGGDIRAQSVLAEGSTFELVMQAREVAPPEARPNDAADCQREESPLADFCGRLLVVDDSPVGQMVAKLLLEQLGFEVDVVGSGAAAIEKIGSVDYRLVFMDCQMPQMDGYETTRRIRSMMQGSRLPPVVALTANVQPSEMQACLECGMDGYLSKPVTRPALIKTLHLHLARPVLH